jgi:hypothetical protein
VGDCFGLCKEDDELLLRALRLLPLRRDERFRLL